MSNHRPQPNLQQEPAIAARGGKGRAEDVLLRPPRAEDGLAVHALIGATPPLDRNSVYCNLLQCTHFAATCVAAELDGRLAGWVSAYRPPEELETLFVWQVAVASEARGRGLAARMLADLLSRPACRDIKFLKTTITQENEASWALFRRVARERGAAFEAAPWFFRHTHFAGHHATEHLVTIGPFSAAATQR